MLTHHSCFVIESIAKALHQKIQHSKLIDCFSNSPNELIICFENTVVKCNFFNGELLFDIDEQMIGKSRLFKPQFTEVIDSSVESVITHPFDRSFHIQLSNNFLLFFKCFGRKSNVMLIHNNQTIEHFCKHIETDMNFVFNENSVNRQLDFEPHVFNELSLFKKKYSFLPETLFYQLHNNPSEEIFTHEVNKLRSIKGFEIDENTNLFIPADDKNNVLEVFSKWTRQFIGKQTYEQQKSELQQQVEKKIQEKEAYLQTNLKALESLKLQRNDEEIGHIILSNLHQINPDLSKQVLLDIYNQTTIEVPYDNKLNAVENANKYFRKSKGRPYLLQQLSSKIDKAQLQLDQLRLTKEKLQNAENLKQLKPYKKEQNATDSIQDLPYKLFTIDDYSILVGKHAESNEKLLNYYSDKNDIWLHAKDVSGSHVIIKVKKGKELPLKVIEKGASLAAYYSKNRKQSLVTVMYTLRKFVRKIKGAEKGHVTVSNEKTLLVKPDKQ
jgi:predicted ribosome quality control (RQC) complex YloA/Tae2 family protein